MSVAMIGPKFYAWDRNGKPLAFGKLYTYQARTNNPKDTYQSEDQITANSNPVILNGEGYADVYLSGSYKMVLKDDDENEIWTSDPVSSAEPSEWVLCLTATYVSSTILKVNGNFTEQYSKGRRVRIDNDAAEYSYSTIVSSTFAASETTIEIMDAVVTTGVVEVCASIVTKNSQQDLSLYTALVFDNVLGLKSGVTSGGENISLSTGSSVKTLGYSSPNDDGGASYIIVNNGTGVDDGGSYIDLDNGLQAELVTSSTVNVKQFGTVNDGDTDDAPFIQNAYDFIKNTTRKLYVPKDTYTIATQINLDGDRVTIDMEQSSIFNYSDSNVGHLLSCSGQGGVVVGGIFDGQNLTPPSTESNEDNALIVIKKDCGITFENCEFKNVSKSTSGKIALVNIDLDGTDTKFLRCSFRNSVFASIGSSPAITDSKLISFKNSPHSVSTPAKSLIKDCNFSDVYQTLDGIPLGTGDLDGKAIRAYWEEVWGDVVFDIKIINNTFQRFSEAGCKLTGIKGTLVSGNKFLADYAGGSSAYGYRNVNGGNSVVDGNVFYGTFEKITETTGNNINVSNNSIEVTGNNFRGIFEVGGSDHIVDGNTIKGNFSGRMFVVYSGSDNILISNNILSLNIIADFNLYASTVLLSQSSDVVLSGNIYTFINDPAATSYIVLLEVAGDIDNVTLSSEKINTSVSIDILPVNSGVASINHYTIEETVITYPNEVGLKNNVSGSLFSANPKHCKVKGCDFVLESLTADATSPFINISNYDNLEISNNTFEISEDGGFTLQYPLRFSDTNALMLRNNTLKGVTTGQTTYFDIRNSDDVTVDGVTVHNGVINGGGGSGGIVAPRSVTGITINNINSVQSIYGARLDSTVDSVIVGGVNTARTGKIFINSATNVVDNTVN